MPPHGFVQEPVPERPERLAVKPSSAPALRVQASSLSLPDARPVPVKVGPVQADVGATKWVAPSVLVGSRATKTRVSKLSLERGQRRTDTVGSTEIPEEGAGAAPVRAWAGTQH